MASITLPVSYSQFDDRWWSIRLGNNTQDNFNIYNYGCLLCCLATTARYYGKEINPEQLNLKLKQNGGFTSNGGDYIWNSITRIYNDIKENKVETPSLLNDAQINEIKSAIDNGYPVMVQLDSNPKTVTADMHFVLIIGYNTNDENDFTIMDPLGGKIRSMKDYLGWFRPNARKTIEKYIIITGPKPKAGVNMISVGKDQWDLMRTNHDKWHSLIHYLDVSLDPNLTPLDKAQSIIAGFKSRVTDLEKQLSNRLIEIELSNTEILNQKDKLANTLKECQITLDTQKAYYESQIAQLPDIQKIEGQYNGTINTLKEDLRQAQKEKGLKDLEITTLKTKLEIAEKGLPTEDFTTVIIGVIKKLFNS